MYQEVLAQLLDGKARAKQGQLSMEPVLKLLHIFTGDHTPEEKKQAWVEQFMKRYGPGRSREEILELMNPLVNRKPIPDAVLEAVTCPVLILFGDDDHAASLDRAKLLQSALTEAPTRQLHIISGAPHYCKRLT